MSADPGSGPEPGARRGPDPRRDAWSDYWQAGVAHSCPGSFGDAYGGVIGQFWRQVIGGMKPDDRVLDVGTGNGPLPKLMADRLGSDCPQVDAVDVATIQPAWWNAATHPRIRFHPGVSAGDLPFEAGSFDWLVSQYGFEYGERASSLAECRRVLRAGARVAMVLHHRDSVVCRVGQAELDHQRFLLSDEGLIAAAARVIPHVHAAAVRGAAAMAADADARTARESYNAAMTEIAARIARMPHVDVLVETRQAVHARVCEAASRPVPSCLLAVQGLADQLRAASTRLEDLLEHALDAGQVDTIARGFASCLESPDGEPAAVGCEPLRQDEGLLGWALRVG